MTPVLENPSGLRLKTVKHPRPVAGAPGAESELMCALYNGYGVDLDIPQAVDDPGDLLRTGGSRISGPEELPLESKSDRPCAIEGDGAGDTHMREVYRWRMISLLRLVQRIARLPLPSTAMSYAVPYCEEEASISPVWALMTVIPPLASPA